MKQILPFYTLFFILIPFTGMAQEMTLLKGGRVSFQGKIISKPKELLPIISPKDSPELTTAFNTYKSNRDWANILGFVGGFGVGYSLGGAIVGRQVNGGLLAGGAAILGVGLLVNGSANRSLQRVVQLFNGGSVSKVKFEPFIKSEGYVNAVGVRFRF